MNLLPTAEQLHIRDSISNFLSAELPATRLHKAAFAHGAAERRLWAQIAELGWLGLGIAEEVGGVGYGTAEDILLFRECGRQLVSPMVLAGRLGAEVAARSGNRDLADRILTGAQPVVLAHIARPGAGFPSGAASVQLIDAAPDDLALAWSPSGMALCNLADFATQAQAPGIDPTLGITTGRTERFRPVAWCPSVTAPLPALASILLSAMLVGIAEATRDMAVNYASFREQFGRKIGSFQAIAHYCANMAMSAEVAWAETAYAGLAWQGRAGDYASHVAASRLLASTAALENARLCIQVHGGMGYSSECDAHLFLKRGHALAVLFGPMREAWSALLSLNDNILNLAAE